MVFDTTSVNSGKDNGVCTKLQQRLQKKLLWCACRHHIGEIIIKHVWDALKIETSSGPEIALFRKFREEFHVVKETKLENLISMDNNLVNKLDLQEINSLLKISLAKGYTRGEYKELVELSLAYMKSPLEKFKIRKPGDMHKAR